MPATVSSTNGAGLPKLRNIARGRRANTSPNCPGVSADTQVMNSQPAASLPAAASSPEIHPASQ